MSEIVKLAGRLPGSFENNGMPAVASDLLKDGATQRLAVIWYDVLTTGHNNDTGDDIATMRVLRIEPMGSVGAATSALREMVMQAAEARTGKAPLPFDQVEPEPGSDDGDGAEVLGDDD